MLAKFILSVLTAGVVACGASTSKSQGEGAARPGGETSQEQTEQETTLPTQVHSSELPSSQPIQTARKTNQQQNQQTMNQGIKGKVIFRQGDFMPSPDAPPQGSGRGVKRELYIHELTNMGQVQGEPPFYQQIQTKLVKKIVSDESGNFTVELQPGKYSLFVKEKDGYYANLFDGQSNIYPVEVKNKQVTEVEFIIDHQATY
jgi:hypothetical protein